MIIVHTTGRCARLGCGMELRKQTRTRENNDSKLSVKIENDRALRLFVVQWSPRGSQASRDWVHSETMCSVMYR